VLLITLDKTVYTTSLSAHSPVLQTEAFLLTSGLFRETKTLGPQTTCHIHAEPYLPVSAEIKFYIHLLISLVAKTSLHFSMLSSLKLKCSTNTMDQAF
jgi:hypothetical protein